MNCSEAMQRLAAAGSAQTKKTYQRHGIKPPLFGVKYGDLNKIARAIKTDHELALELWATGNHDARVLASMVADPDLIKLKTLVEWSKDVDSHGLTGALSNVAQRSRFATKLLRKWVTSRDEWVATTGWMILAGLARERPDILTKAECGDWLATIEDEIHDAKNCVKYSMNGALISIGAHVAEKDALRVARRIGEVDIDHGDTSCKTPFAPTAIAKAVQKKAARSSSS